MQCPACSRPLKEVTAGDIQVDVCHGGCGGIWFDDGELDQFDEQSEIAAEVLLKEENGATVKTDGKSLRHCPRCENEVLVRQFFDPKNQVEINQCWKCCGIWLDRGELATIRSQFKTATDRAKAINEYADQCMDQHLAAIKQAGKMEMREYNKETSTRFKSFLYGFKQLLGKE
ncbi:MAG: zf-TFIIB domain-containing protein [Deltaproteobacteria bacterium]|nr:zf-TFIIB domain-containing protein [Deltaproteobacteria bacterium]